MPKLSFPNITSLDGVDVIFLLPTAEEGGFSAKKADERYYNVLFAYFEKSKVLCLYPSQSYLLEGDNPDVWLKNFYTDVPKMFRKLKDTSFDKIFRSNNKHDKLEVEHIRFADESHKEMHIESQKEYKITDIISESFGEFEYQYTPCALDMINSYKLKNKTVIDLNGNHEKN